MTVTFQLVFHNLTCKIASICMECENALTSLYEVFLLRIQKTRADICSQLRYGSYYKSFSKIHLGFYGIASMNRYPFIWFQICYHTESGGYSFQNVLVMPRLVISGLVWFNLVMFLFGVVQFCIIQCDRCPNMLIPW